MWSRLRSESNHTIFEAVERNHHKKQFQFLVEVDNIPCQNCMKKADAELLGLHNFAFDSEEDAE